MSVIPFDEAERVYEAEKLAIRVLAFIGSDESRLKRFLDLTRIDVDHLREMAKCRGFLLGILDYAVKEESLMAALSIETGVAAEEVITARTRLAPKKLEPSVRKRSELGMLAHRPLFN
jgi:hypothetical protein